MATPNYRFDKRQREMKKLKQQEEKRQKKLARNTAAEAPTEKTGAELMTKGVERKKESKKKPALNLKEKRAAKAEKERQKK